MSTDLGHVVIEYSVMGNWIYSPKEGLLIRSKTVLLDGPREDSEIREIRFNARGGSGRVLQIRA